MTGKKRLDTLVFEKGFTDSRERAKTTIMSGVVYVNGQKMDKPGMNVASDAEIEVRGGTREFVSRGGFKLKKALTDFNIDVKGKTAVDIGASTGGFTDCLLQSGAAKVYAVDVGYGQLSFKLRNDPRVFCMERTNIRYLEPCNIPDEIDFAAIDVSFISLKLVLPVVFSLLRGDGEAVTLIKPQFEAGRDKVGKKGVVREPCVHSEVLEAFLKNVRDAGFYIKALTFSPIKGPEGNIEYLAYITKSKDPEYIPDIDSVVLNSHTAFQ